MELLDQLTPLSSLWKKIPLDIQELLDFFLTRGDTLTLVGGASRTFLLHDHLPFDLDFEWRQNLHQQFQLSDFSLTDENKLSKKFSCEKLPFEVLRFHSKNFPLWSIEFSKARKENFTHQANSTHHSQFEGDFSLPMNYADSFRRRDFTINAIGIELKKRVGQIQIEIKLQDPYNGILDLVEKKLTACSLENFPLDPVRFLRAIRLNLTLNFNYGDSLTSCLQKFDLTNLTFFYFLQEGFKSKLFFTYLNNFSNLVMTNLSHKETQFKAPLWWDQEIGIFLRNIKSKTKSKSKSKSKSGLSEFDGVTNIDELVVRLLPQLNQWPPEKLDLIRPYFLIAKKDLNWCFKYAFDYSEKPQKENKQQLSERQKKLKSIIDKINIDGDS
jgi:tRNA nucleotidyltransferase/poly(A) polymerase